MSPYIIGIDPSLKSTGWAVIQPVGDLFTIIDCGHIPVRTRTNEKEASELQGLSTIYDVLNEVLIRNIKVSLYGIECPPPVSRRGESTLAQAYGICRCVLGRRGILTGGSFYPVTVKKTIAGLGSAEKSDVERCVSALLTDRWEFECYDESDAAAVAMTFWRKK
jgi:crossover junction endodeoxyribonuclease RuvC